jgi:hypothetical protein
MAPATKRKRVVSRKRCAGDEKLVRCACGRVLPNPEQTCEECENYVCDKCVETAEELGCIAVLCRYCRVGLDPPEEGES